MKKWIKRAWTKCLEKYDDLMFSRRFNNIFNSTKISKFTAKSTDFTVNGTKLLRKSQKLPYHGVVIRHWDPNFREWDTVVAEVKEYGQRL